MSKEETKDLVRFLKVFPEDTVNTVLWLRDFVWDLYPNSNELIYDNYNALAFGWSLTDRQSHLFCNIAVGRTNNSIQFGFYYGAELADPKKILIGNGNQYRYLVVKNQAEFPRTYMKKLLKEAYSLSRGKVKDTALLSKGLTIVKSVSAKKRVLKKKSSTKSK